MRVRGLDAVAEPAPPDERHRRREHARIRAGRRRRLPGGGLQGGPGHAVQAGRGGAGLSRPGRAQAHAGLLPGAACRGARDRRERATPRAGRAHAAPPGRGDAASDPRAVRPVSASLARHLACIDCGATFPLDYVLECAKCHGLLELVYDLACLRRDGPSALSGTGLWRYAAMLPIEDPAHRLTLGEGGTPLLEAPPPSASLGARPLPLKCGGATPTGTVKDPSSATAIAAALKFGFRATSVVSSGNAGSSIAAYSARAGLRSLVFAYEGAS